MVGIHQANIDIRVTESVCAFVAICFTVVRLYIRRTRLWWDDAWTIFSFIFVLLQIVAAFLHVDDYCAWSKRSSSDSVCQSKADKRPHVAADLPKSGHIAAYYLLATTFYCIIWSARLSILFSIIRIDPDPRWQHRLKWVAAIFVAALLFFLAQLFWVCEPKGHEWKNLPSPQCHLGLQVVICQVVSDVIADLLLITLPIRLIYGMTDRSLRRRLMFIFSTAIVTTFVSLVHAAYIIKDGTTSVLISAVVEDCMSLTVANFPVVATAALRKLPFGTTGPSGGATTDESANDGRHWKSTGMRFRSMFPTVTRDNANGGGKTTIRWGANTTRDQVGTTGGGGASDYWGQSTGAGTTESGMSGEDSVRWASVDKGNHVKLDVEAGAGLGSRASSPGPGPGLELKSGGDVPLALVSHPR
ncbi:hypothetical protein PENSPDRAFT_747132 [Peniophora sp. CONT]|nr:hypothetical protein PENSPDRAFT_747132 [Peniophora sp. CONT]